MVKTTVRLVHGPCREGGGTKAAELFSEGIGLEDTRARVKVTPKLPRNCGEHHLRLPVL